MNIGVLGGTFDPPHDAHLRISERSIEQFSLDKVIFIPSGNPWQKKDSTSYLHRYEMTKILIEDSNYFEISDIENSEKNPSYTFETLKKLNHPKEKLYFILGSDAAINIKTWKNYELLPNLTNFLIALRSKDNIDVLDQNFPFDYKIINGDKLDLSSTTLRNKLIKKNNEVSDLPSEILNYINENNLY
tara:strand:+ start:108 stop:671 length:564 start_codon:yes stop_codon:yes gene_type:complete